MGITAWMWVAGVILLIIGVLGLVRLLARVRPRRQISHGYRWRRMERIRRQSAADIAGMRHGGTFIARHGYRWRRIERIGEESAADVAGMGDDGTLISPDAPAHLEDDL